MAVKTCCINTCTSSSDRAEDKGVTYLRFPKDPTLRELWCTATRQTDSKQPQPSYVCSRHFCKNDFEKHDSKYVLKSDAVPSIFSWIFEEIDEKVDETEMESKTEESSEPKNQIDEILNSSKESEPENLEAIRDFILAQEQEIIDAKTEKSSQILSETAESAEVNKITSPVIGNIKKVIETLENMQKAAENYANVSNEDNIAPNEDENLETLNLSHINEQEIFLGFENPEKAKTEESKEIPSLHNDLKIDTQDIRVEPNTINEVKKCINVKTDSETSTKSCANVSNDSVSDTSVNVTNNNVTDTSIDTSVNPVTVTIGSITNIKVNDTTVNVTDNSIHVETDPVNKTIDSATDNSVNVTYTSVNVNTDPITVKEEDAIMAEAANVMAMILSETEAKLDAHNNEANQQESSPSKNRGPGEKGNTMSLSVGSKVEARDFGDDWHPAEIMEVDFEEMEVLVHYDPLSKKIIRPDEWISVSSPRLRPEGSGPLKETTPPPEIKPETPEPLQPPIVIKEEVKHEEKPKKTFEVGERCLARYKDNRRFAATISTVLGDGMYEIVFDDGARWTCNTSRLYKTKETNQLDMSLPLYTPPTGAAALGSSSAPPVHYPLYNTHLFDPARDYLGSKSDRRERKRKLNIKEIFNIGQKKPKKMDVTPKTSKPRPPPKEKKPAIVRKKIEMPTKEVKQEPSQPVPSLPVTKEVLLTQPIEVANNIPNEEVMHVASEQNVVDQVLVPKIEDQEVGDSSPQKIIPEVVASIIGANIEDEIKEEIKDETEKEIKQVTDSDNCELLDVTFESDCKIDNNLEVVSVDIDAKMDIDIDIDVNSETLSAPESQAMKEEDEDDIVSLIGSEPESQAMKEEDEDDIVSLIGSEPESQAMKEEDEDDIVSLIGSEPESQAMKEEDEDDIVSLIGSAPESQAMKEEDEDDIVSLIGSAPESQAMKEEDEDDIVSLIGSEPESQAMKKEDEDDIVSLIGSEPESQAMKKEDEDDIVSLIGSEPESQAMKKEDEDDIVSLIGSEPESQAMKEEDEDDIGLAEDVKREKFDHQDSSQSGEVIDRIKEVLTKLEDNLSEISTKSDIIKNIESPKVVIKEDDIILSDLKPSEDKLKNLAKVKKGKKLRLLQEKKVKKQVEKVKCELEVMKKQMEDMKKAMLLKTEEIAMGKSSVEMPESFLLPGEWCCKWVNGQPVGTVSEIEGDVKVGLDNKPALPRRSVQVEDKRLPAGWTKHMVRRSYGSSAGKWDVVIVNPENRRFHTKTEMRHHLEHNPEKAEALKDYHPALFDFGVHLKLSRRMGWYTTTPDGRQETPTLTLPALPAGTLHTTSPLVKRKKLTLTKKARRERDRLRREERKETDKERHRRNALSKAALLKAYANYPAVADTAGPSSPLLAALQAPVAEPVAVVPVSPILPVSGPSMALHHQQPPLEDGYVYVGTLKVQIIMNLLRCPAEGCYKNFRNNTLLKMHIKHYHRELIICLGETPQVLDLAYARNKPPTAPKMLKLEAQRKARNKHPRPSKRIHPDIQTINPNTQQVAPSTPNEKPKQKRSQESPKLRHALGNKIRRPKVLLPVRKHEQLGNQDQDDEQIPLSQEPVMPPLDFETAISTHTVTKPLGVKLNRKSLATVSKITSEDDWMASDPDTRSSNARSGTPDINTEHKFVFSESNVGDYTYTETGEKVKIEHMKREEIINCHCGFREEDGLMVQCELCLCWQHATCHNIQREADVPDKYTCSICLNPRRGRRSQRFLHDQDRLYEGLLPGAKPSESLRRSHELSGNLLRIQDALHALRVKYHVATKKDHPKLYLWAKDWETTELNMTQEKLNSDYSDLNIMINSIGKENLPMKDDLKDITLDIGIKTPPLDDPDIERFSQKDCQLGANSLLSGLLSSPGGASLELPISTQELERLAKTVQEEAQRVIAPQPEAAIEDSACRERLLRHLQRCQALVDARLDSIEAQVAELESQDPLYGDEETAEYIPRTKQTVQMLIRDLNTMEELGIIT